MKLIYTSPLFLSLAFLISCASSVTMTGKQYPPVETEQVKILFRDKPDCKYEELGFVSSPQLFGQNRAIESARKAAASIGADYLLIENVQRNNYGDFMVSGMAYKCQKVDRNKVDAKPKGG